MSRNCLPNACGLGLQTMPDFEHPVWKRSRSPRKGRNSSAKRGDSLKWRHPIPRFQMLGHPMPMQTSVCWDIETTFSREPAAKANSSAAGPAVGTAVPGPRPIRRLQPVLYDPPRRPAAPPLEQGVVLRASDVTYLSRSGLRDYRGGCGLHSLTPAAGSLPHAW